MLGLGGGFGAHKSDRASEDPDGQARRPWGTPGGEAAAALRKPPAFHRDGPRADGPAPLPRHAPVTPPSKMLFTYRVKGTTDCSQPTAWKDVAALIEHCMFESSELEVKPLMDRNTEGIPFLEPPSVGLGADAFVVFSEAASWVNSGGRPNPSAAAAPAPHPLPVDTSPTPGTEADDGVSAPHRPPRPAVWGRGSGGATTAATATVRDFSRNAMNAAGATTAPGGWRQTPSAEPGSADQGGDQGATPFKETTAPPLVPVGGGGTEATSAKHSSSAGASPVDGDGAAASVDKPMSPGSGGPTRQQSWGGASAAPSAKPPAGGLPPKGALATTTTTTPPSSMHSPPGGGAVKSTATGSASTVVSKGTVVATAPIPSGGRKGWGPPPAALATLGAAKGAPPPPPLATESTASGSATTPISPPSGFPTSPMSPPPLPAPAPSPEPTGTRHATGLGPSPTVATAAAPETSAPPHRPVSLGALAVSEPEPPVLSPVAVTLPAALKPITVSTGAAKLPDQASGAAAVDKAAAVTEVATAKPIDKTPGVSARKSSGAPRSVAETKPAATGGEPPAPFPPSVAAQATRPDSVPAVPSPTTTVPSPSSKAPSVPPTVLHAAEPLAAADAVPKKSRGWGEPVTIAAPPAALSAPQAANVVIWHKAPPSASVVSSPTLDEAFTDVPKPKPPAFSASAAAPVVASPIVEAPVPPATKPTLAVPQPRSQQPFAPPRAAANAESNEAAVATLSSTAVVAGAANGDAAARVVDEAAVAQEAQRREQQREKWREQRAHFKAQREAARAVAAAAPHAGGQSKAPRQPATKGSEVDSPAAPIAILARPPMDATTDVAGGAAAAHSGVFHAASTGHSHRGPTDVAALASGGIKSGGVEPHPSDGPRPPPKHVLRREQQRAKASAAAAASDSSSASPPSPTTPSPTAPSPTTAHGFQPPPPRSVQQRQRGTVSSGAHADDRGLSSGQVASDAASSTPAVGEDANRGAAAPPHSSHPYHAGGGVAPSAVNRGERGKSKRQTAANPSAAMPCSPALQNAVATTSVYGGLPPPPPLPAYLLATESFLVPATAAAFSQPNLHYDEPPRRPPRADRYDPEGQPKRAAGAPRQQQTAVKHHQDHARASEGAYPTGETHHHGTTRTAAGHRQGHSRGEPPSYDRSVVPADATVGRGSYYVLHGEDTPAGVPHDDADDVAGGARGRRRGGRRHRGGRGGGGEDAGGAADGHQ